MKSRKGLNISPGMIFVGLIAVALVGGAFWTLTQDQQQEASVIQDFDGYFATYQPIQEVSGYNDLSVTQQALNESGQVDDANAVTKFNINSSDGDTIRWAFGLEVDGPMEAVDAEVVNEGVEGNLDLMEAKIIPDEDDEISIAEATPVATFNIDSDDEVDQTIQGLEDGDYAVVLEARGTDTSGISTDQDLYTVNMDAETDADSDEAEEVHVTIDNAQ